MGSFLFLDKTYVYEYNGSRKDQLTEIKKYEGDTVSTESFVYDALGNPTTYRNKPLVWSDVSKLTSYDGNTFTYNASGMRISKNGITYEYDGDKLRKEHRSIGTFEYIYGVDGILGFKYGDNYYLYQKNIFGDVISLIQTNSLRTEWDVVAYYLYDAWGNATVCNKPHTNDEGSVVYEVNNNSDFIGNINPIRYRGYYYDTETKLYYLETRYYDPEIGRFISPDATKYLDPSALGGLNLYAYCNNNPVMYADPSGTSITALLAIAIGTILGGVIALGTDIGKQVLIEDVEWEDIDWGRAFNKAIVGAALGFSLAMGVAYLGPLFASFTLNSARKAILAWSISVGVSCIAGASGYILEETKNDRTPNLNTAVGHGIQTARKGNWRFITGGFIGASGKHIGTKGPFFSIEWWKKTGFGLATTFPWERYIDEITKDLI